jgi:monoamine oxidase
VGPEWIHTNPKILQDLILPFEGKIETVTEETILYKPQTWRTYTNGKVHSRDFLRHFYSEHKFKDTTWFSYLQKYILKRVNPEKLHLNSVVKTIDMSGSAQNGIKVTTESEKTFTGSHVFVTVSAGILQQNAIQFIPELPQKIVAEINKITFAPGFKLLMEFQERFYPDHQYVGGITRALSLTNEKIYFDAMFGKPTTRHVLGSLQMGRDSADRAKLSDKEIIQEALEELNAIFDGKPSKLLVKAEVQNWSAEPFVQGTYSVSLNHDKTLISNGVKTQAGRLFFGGEHLATPMVTVHGSAFCGRCAMEKILKEG